MHALWPWPQKYDLLSRLWHTLLIVHNIVWSIIQIQLTSEKWKNCYLCTVTLTLEIRPRFKVMQQHFASYNPDYLPESASSLLSHGKDVSVCKTGCFTSYNPDHLPESASSLLSHGKGVSMHKTGCFASYDPDNLPQSASLLLSGVTGCFSA